MIRLLGLPFRLLFGSVRVGYHAGRAVGAGRALFFGVGFATGVLVASPGARRLAYRGTMKGIAAVRKPEPPAEEPAVG